MNVGAMNVLFASSEGVIMTGVNMPFWFHLQDDAVSDKYTDPNDLLCRTLYTYLCYLGPRDMVQVALTVPVCVWKKLCSGVSVSPCPCHSALLAPVSDCKSCFESHCPLSEKVILWRRLNAWGPFQASISCPLEISIEMVVPSHSI